MNETAKNQQTSLPPTRDIVIATAAITATVMLTKNTMSVTADVLARPLRKMADKLERKTEEPKKS